MLHNLELAGCDHALELLLVTLLDSVHPHGVAHSGDQEATHLEGDVHVLKSSVWHVAGHPDTTGGNDVVLVLKFGGELIDSLT